MGDNSSVLVSAAAASSNNGEGFAQTVAMPKGQPLLAESGATGEAPAQEESNGAAAEASTMPEGGPAPSQ